MLLLKPLMPAPEEMAALALAPAASAKGPHAVLSSGDGPVEAGRAWHVMVELVEFGQRRPQPVLEASTGEHRIAVRGSRGGAKHAFRVVFPAEGRWRLTLADGKRRFVFPAVSVGSSDVPRDYVAFPKGSMAERQGSGGVSGRCGRSGSCGHGQREARGALTSRARRSSRNS
jgi:hypothetical protein